MQYAQPTQQSDLLTRAIERMQVKEATKTYNEVVERCFEFLYKLTLIFRLICASNFRTSKLDNQETMCMDRCFEKFVKYTQRLSTAFQEQNMLAAEELPK